MKRICKLISDYMGVLVLLAAVAALLWPDAFNGIKPTVINPLLGIIMFGMGLSGTVHRHAAIGMGTGTALPTR